MLGRNHQIRVGQPIAQGTFLEAYGAQFRLFLQLHLRQRSLTDPADRSKASIHCENQITDSEVFDGALAHLCLDHGSACKADDVDIVIIDIIDFLDVT